MKSNEFNGSNGFLRLAILVLAVLFARPMRSAAQTATLDVAGMLVSGQATATYSALDIGQIEDAFDGRTDSLARSRSVSPLVVTLSFASPQRLVGSQVWFLGGSNRWRVETADSLAELNAASGSYRIALDWATDDESAWRQRAFVAPVACRAIRLTLERLTGDDFVHLNEWQLFLLDQSPQTLSWTSPAVGTPLRLNQPQALAATASSGLTVGFRVQSGPAKIDGGTVIATNVGLIVLVAEQAGDDTRASASLVRTFNPSSVRTEAVGQWPGIPRGDAEAIRVRGNRAYLALGGAGMAIFDVADPAQPVRLGGLYLDWASGIDATSEIAYVAGGWSGLHLLDVRDPAHPVRLGLYDTPGIARDVHLAGNLAYVADGESGLQILDVSQPANPMRVGGYRSGGWSYGVQVVGNLAYLADGGAGLRILDVSDPSHPVAVGGFETPGETRGVQVVGNLAYLADGGMGVQIVDVQDPAHPVAVGAFDTSGWAVRVQLIGNYAYVADLGGGLQIADVSDPTHPVLVRREDGEPYNLQVVDNLVFLADGRNGLRILDVSAPAAPVRIGGLDTSGFSEAVQVVGHVAYVADWSRGLEILDVTDPSRPVRIGGYDTDGLARGLRVRDDLALVADDWRGVKAIDVSVPASPLLKGGYVTSGYAVGLQRIGNLAYVADGYSGLVILDVANLSAPMPVGSYATASVAHAVQVVDNLAYLMTDGSLEIVDVSRPFAPVRVGGYPFGGNGLGVQVVGHRAYLACGWGGVQMIDVSDPARPICTGLYRSSGFVRAVQVLDRLAFVAAENSGIEIVDVADPARPVRLGGYDTPGFARAVHAVGDLAYVADQFSGLQVVRWREGVSQALDFNPASMVELSASPLTLSATGSSGLPVTFSVVSGPGTVAGNQLTLTGTGTLVVRAEQAGDMQFLPVSQERSIQVIASSQRLILQVVESGGDDEPTDTITAKWSGETFVNGVASEPVTGKAADDPYTVGLFLEDAPMFVDRNHQWNGATSSLPIPDYLLGGEYIMSGNDNRDNADYRLDITLSRDCVVYLLVDNRLGDGSDENPPNYPNWSNDRTGDGRPDMAWLRTEGWQPVKTGWNRSQNADWPDEVGADENSDGVGPGIGINHWSSVYAKRLPAGTFTLGPPHNNFQNMYGVVVKDPANSVVPAMIARLTPGDGVTAVLQGTGIEGVIRLGSQSLDLAAVRLFFDDEDTLATATLAGQEVRIQYQPPGPLAPRSVHYAELRYVQAGQPVVRRWSFTVMDWRPLTADMKVVADTSKPGFTMRIFQNAGRKDNSSARAEAALAGRLVDGNGDLLPNLADPSAKGPALAVALPSDPANGTLRFEVPGVINMDQEAGSSRGNFPNSDLIPGVPGTTGSNDGIAGEFMTYVELPAGVTTLGVNSDDGFLTTVGEVGEMSGAFMVGVYEGGRGASDTMFQVVVEEAGVYALRTIWYEGEGDANIELFSVKSDGTKVLLNDVANGGLRCWRERVYTAPELVSSPAEVQHRPDGVVRWLQGSVRGGGLSYQWEKDGETLPGATGPVLPLGLADLGDAGDYRLIASNPVGSVTSAVARVSVDMSLASVSAGRPAVWGQTTQRQLVEQLPADVVDAVAVGGGQGHAAALRRNGTVVAWGDNWAGQTAVPAGLGGVVGLAVSAHHTLALAVDGTLTSWGWNNSGQAIVPAGLGPVRAVAAGVAHNLAVKPDGTVAAWGDGGDSRLAVPAGLTGVVSVAAGWNSVALLRDGSVVGWGRWASSVPNGRDFVDVAAGNDHVLALRADGRVVAWGENGSGQCNVPEGATNVVGIRARGNNSLAIQADGTVLVWGQVPAAVPAGMSVWNPALGQECALGVVPEVPPVVPTVTMVGFADDNLQLGEVVRVGAWARVGVKGVPPLSGEVEFFDGAVLLGRSTLGEPGWPWTEGWAWLSVTGLAQGWHDLRVRYVANPPYAASESPVRRLKVYGSHTALAMEPSALATEVDQGLSVQVTAVAKRAGAGPVLGTVILRRGKVTEPWNAPEVARGTLTNGQAVLSFTSATPGRYSLFAELVDSDAFQWSRSLDRWVTVEAASEAPLVSQQPAGVDFVSSGQLGYLQVGASGGALRYQWRRGGEPVTGAIGRVLPLNPHDPSTVGSYDVVVWNSLGAVTSQVAVVTANIPDLSVGAWGANNSGQSTVPSELRAVAVRAGAEHALALRRDGSLVSWGRNTDGQSSVPAELGLPGSVIAMGTGWATSLAVRPDGSVVAWGRGTTDNGAVPFGLPPVVQVGGGEWNKAALLRDGSVVVWGAGQSVPAEAVDVVALECGFYGTLALRADGTVVAWGGGNEANVPAGLTDVAAIAAGRGHGLALKRDGLVVAWGDNHAGQSALPSGLAGVRGIGVGHFHSLAIRGDGTAAAWGNNSAGQTSVPTGLGGVRYVTGGEQFSVVLADNVPVVPATIVRLTPGDGATGVSFGTSIEAVIRQGGRTLDLNAARLLFDGQDTMAVATLSGEEISIRYQPSAPLPALSSHTAELRYVEGGEQLVQRWSFTVMDWRALTADTKVVPDTSKPGFTMRIFQNAGRTDNSSARAEAALAGRLLDGTGNLLPNLADPLAKGPALAVALPADPANGTLRFEVPGVINMDQEAGASWGNFPDADPFPGIPGTTGSTDGIAAEFLTFVELPAGMTTLGVNSDDGFRTSGGLVRDQLLGLMLGQFEGGRGAGDTLFDVWVEEAGVYPLRTIWYEGGGGANLELFSVLPDGTRVLLNDVANGGLRCWRAALSVGPGLARPVVVSATPMAGATDQPLRPSVSVVIDDAGAPAVDSASVRLQLGSTTPSVSLARTNTQTWVTARAIADFPGNSSVPVQLTFADVSGRTYTYQWSFNTTLWIPGTIFIEAEDFDFGKGQFVTGVAIGMTGPYPGGAYVGQGTTEDQSYDYEANGNAGQPGRQDTRVGVREKSDLVFRGGFNVLTNYVVGWNDQGEWRNYTRDFPLPARDYLVYGQFSSGANPIDVDLSQVTAGAGTATQTLDTVGVFRPGRSTGDWNKFEVFPLLDPQGQAPVPLRLGGRITLRLTTLGSDDDDFLAFVPLGGNTPPVWTPLADVQALEEQELELGLRAQDAESSTSELVYELVSGPAGMTVASDGVLRWTPDEASGPGTYEVTVRVLDAGAPALEASQSFTVTVAEVNTPPQVPATADVAVAEGSTVSLFLSATDRDEPAQPVVFSLVSGPAGMSVSPAGQLVWATTESDGPSVTLVIVAVSDGVISAQTSFQVQVTEENQAPVPEAQANLAVLEGESLRVVLKARDADLPSQPLSFALVSGPPGMSLTGDGILEWTPGETDGPAMLTIQASVSDGVVNASVEFQVEVREGNQPPRLAAISDQAIDEGSPLALTLAASDADLPAQTLVYQLVSGPEGMTVTSGGSLEWTPGESQGPATQRVRVSVRDGIDTAFGEFTVLVREVNQPPLFAATAEQGVDEMATLTVTLVGSEPDVPAQSLTFTLLEGPAGLNVSAAGILSWTPTEGQGPTTNGVRVALSDGELSVTNTVTVVVREVNQAPVFAAVADRTIDEWTTLNVALSASDADLPAQTLSYALVDGPTGMSVSAVGALQWTPGEAEGPSTNAVLVSASDGTASVTNRFTVVVREINQPPVPEEVPPVQVAESTALRLQLTAQDADLPAQAFTYSRLAGPAGLTVSADGVVSWTPTEQAQGPSTNTVSVRVTDSGAPALSATNTFTVVVTEANTPPTLASVVDQSLDEGTALAIDLQGADADLPAQGLTYRLVSGPAGMTLSPGGRLSWAPGEAQGPSTNAVVVAVSDGTAEATRSFQVVVREVNSAPAFVQNGPLATDEGVPFNLQVQAIDTDVPTQRLTFVRLNGPAGLSVLADGQVQWTPGETQGPSTNLVVVLVTDDGVPSLSATNTLTVVVREVNQVPVLAAVPDQVMPAGTALDLPLVATDDDRPAQPLSFVLVAGPVGMAVSPEGRVTWNPATGQIPSTNAVTVAVRDNGMPVQEARWDFRVRVLPPNTGPTLGAVPLQVVDELAPLELQLTATHPTLNTASLKYRLVEGPAGLLLGSSGLLTWVPGEAQGPSTNQVRVGVSDEEIETTGTVTIEVREVNVPPVVGPVDPVQWPEGRPFVIEVPTTDPDLPRQDLAWRVVSSRDDVVRGVDLAVSPGTNSILVAGSPRPGAVGSVALTVTVTDALGGAGSTAVALSLQARPPSIVSLPDGTNVFVGDTLSLAVVADGTAPLSYQWFRDGTALEGATSASLSLAGMTRELAGVVTVQVSGPGGSLLSGAIPVTVSDRLAFLEQPVGREIAPGETLLLQALAQGGGEVTYQWFFNQSPIPGATSADLQVPSMDAGKAGVYQVEARSGDAVVRSDEVVVSVFEAVQLGGLPAETAVAEGGTLRLAPTIAGSEPMSFRWLKDEFELPVTEPVLEIPSIGVVHEGTYRLLGVNRAGQAAIETRVVVRRAPQVRSLAGDQRVAAGQTLSLDVVAEGTVPMRYQWWFLGTGATEGVAIPDGTNRVLTVSPAGGANAGAYWVEVANSVDTVRSGVIQVEVLDGPGNLRVTGASDVPSGGRLFLSVASAGTPPLHYEWLKDGSPLAAPDAPTLEKVDVTSLDDGAYRVRVRNDLGEAFSDPVDVRVFQSPRTASLTLSPSVQPALAGQPIRFDVVADGTGPLTYEWRRGGVVLPAVSGPEWTFTPTVADEGTYVVAARNVAGEVVTAPVELQVSEPPHFVQQPQSVEALPGTAVTLVSLASGEAPLSYQWYFNDSPLSGQTNAELALASISSADAGRYYVVAVNPVGSSTSLPARLEVLLPSVGGGGDSDQAGSLPGDTSGSFVLGSPGTGGSARALAARWRWRGQLSSAPASVWAQWKAPLTGVAKFNTRGSDYDTVLRVYARTVFGDLVFLGEDDDGAGFGTSEFSFNAFAGATYAIEIAGYGGASGRTIVNFAQLTDVAAAPILTSTPTNRVVALGGSTHLQVGVRSAVDSIQWFRDGEPLLGQTQPRLEVGPLGVDDAAVYHAVVANGTGARRVEVVTPPAVVSVGSKVPVVADKLAAALHAPPVSMGASGSMTLGTANLSREPSEPLHSARLSSVSAWSAWVAPSEGLVEFSTEGSDFDTVLAVYAGTSIRTLSLLAQNNDVGPDRKWSRVYVPVSPGQRYLVAVGGENQASGRVRLSYAFGTRPTVTVAAVSGVFMTGQRVRLSGTYSASLVAASEPPQFQWFHDGVPVAGARQTSLELEGLRLEDAGGYELRMTLSGTVYRSGTAVLRVLAPVSLAATGLDPVVVSGSPVRVAPTVTGSGTIAYQWSRDGQSLVGATSSELLIPNATQADQGVYQLRAANSVSEAVSRPVRLTVLGDLRALTVQGGGELRAGDSLELRVVGEEGQNLRFQWSRGSELLPGATQRSLALSGITVADAGEYSVDVRNALQGVTVGPAKVAVYPMLRIVNQPQGQTISEGSPVALAVASVGGGARSFQWFQDGRPLVGATNESLRFAAVAARAAGSYVVQIRDGTQSLLSEPARLEVLTAPTIVRQPEGAVVPYLGSHRLAVQVESSGTVTYQWLKNGVILGGATAPHLDLTKVLPTDAGDYEVIARNAVGSTRSARVAVTVDPTPWIEGRALTLNEGQPVVIDPVVNSLVPLTYRWLKSGVPVPGATDRVYRSGLATTGDGGLYQLEARPESGSAVVGSFPVTINRAPVAVDDLITATSSATEQIRVADLLANDSDPENDGLRVVAVADPAAGASVALVGDRVLYARGPGETQGFSYVVRDSRGAESTGLVTLRDSEQPSGIVVSLSPSADGGMLLVLSWTSQSGAIYQVETSTDLVHWVPEGASVVASGPATSVSVTTSGPGGGRFFRVLNTGAGAASVEALDP